MEFYVSDIHKKKGYYYNDIDKLYHFLNKTLYKKFGEPEYFFEDISNLIDTRRDCIPVGDNVVFLSETNYEQTERNKDHFFTWKINILPLTPKKFREDEIPLLKEIREIFQNNQIKTIEYKTSLEKADLIIRRLQNYKPLFQEIEDHYIYKPEVSVSKYRNIQKVWIGLIRNNKNKNIRRSKIKSLDKEIDIHLIIFGEKGREIKRREIEKLYELSDFEILEQCFPVFKFL